MKPGRLAAFVAVDTVAVVALRPDLTLLHHLGAPHDWLAAAGTDAVTADLAAAAAWLAAVWLAVGLLAGAGAALPGAPGRHARALARAVLPRAVYRLAAGAAGMGVLLAPGLAGAADPGNGSPPHRALTAGAPAWPTSDALHPPRWPTASPAQVTPRSHRHPVPQPRPAAVVVSPGDSLWRIAAEHLPGHPSAGRIAAAWPRWYAANRRVVGADPDVIHPGEVLHQPAEGNRS